MFEFGLGGDVVGYFCVGYFWLVMVNVGVVLFDCGWCVLVCFFIGVGKCMCCYYGRYNVIFVVGRYFIKILV